METINNKKMETINITKEDFESYEAVRVSGITNMWAINVVEKFTGLSKKQIMAIMENYEDYEKMFEKEEKE